MQLDLLIFGGGIAGMWTLLRARQAGYRALLLESAALGGVQSIASQGIIHGGTKYALKGAVTESTRAIADMPGIWRDALAGQGDIDLSGVRLLSGHQYLWSSGSLGSSLANLFASKLMQSRVASLKRDAFPAPFDSPRFRGSLYRLQEPVLDTASLMQCLADQAKSWCYRYEPENMIVTTDHVRIGELEIRPQRVLLAAGQGNASLLPRWGLNTPKMQTRPLHMVMVRGKLPPVYAHCLGASSNPRLTITSYPLEKDVSVWYLGGQLAESGVDRRPAEQIARARAELEKLLPWMDFASLDWATLPIDRAEVATPGGKRPDDCFLGGTGSLMTTWPTKLAFAPRLADKVLEKLLQEGVEVSAEEPPPLDLPEPPLAALPWEQASWS
ncbi:FAD-dependent oxidoreductase [Thiolapillus sp.]